MDDSLLVRGFERRGELAGDGERLRDRQCAALEAIGERLAFNQFEHQCADTIRFLQPIDRADVRVIECRERPRFAREAGAAFGIRREVRRQDLDGDVPTELAVARAIDLAHAAGAERGHDRVGADLTIDHRGHTGRIRGHAGGRPREEPRRRRLVSSSDCTSWRSPSSPLHASIKNAARSSGVQASARWYRSEIRSRRSLGIKCFRTVRC